MSTHQKLAHEMLAATAKEMAGCWYEEAAHDNDFYHYYPKQKMFINREWPRFIEAARQTLVKMLGMGSTPEYQKELIADALIKHASLPGNIDKNVAARMIAGGDIPQVTIMPNSYGVH
jgi:hypothetical protein